MGGEPVPGAAFAGAVRALRALELRPEITVEEVPAPRRLAPFAVALEAEVSVDGQDAGDGRLVLLHDPAGHDGWDGDVRVVAFARASCEPEMAADPLLVDVGWAWLTEALEQRGARARVLGGTVTRTVSASYGDLAGRPGRGEVEVRASWTPDGGDLVAHARAWADVLASAAGLHPVLDGVADLDRLRR